MKLNVFTSSLTISPIQVMDAWETQNCPLESWVFTKCHLVSACSLAIEAFMLGWRNHADAILPCWRQGVRRTWNRNIQMLSKGISLFNCSVFKFHVLSGLHCNWWTCFKSFFIQLGNYPGCTRLITLHIYYCSNPHNALRSREDRAFTPSTEYTI